jgi:hypothetical protein
MSFITDIYRISGIFQEITDHWRFIFNTNSAPASAISSESLMFQAIIEKESKEKKLMCLSQV